VRDISPLISDREKIGRIFTECLLVFNYKCTDPPRLAIEVVIRKEVPAEGVSVKATMIIPARCSRKKWLINWARSLIRLSVDVTKEGQNDPINVASTEKKIVSVAESFSGDHHTQLELEDVLAHRTVLYDKASYFVLHFKGELMVRGYAGDESVAALEMVEEKLTQHSKYMVIDWKK